MKLLKQGESSFFGVNRVILVHFEFTSVCNRHCSYCIEGNGDPNKQREPLSDSTLVLSSIDKIFNIARENDFIGFIIAGGEPTLQPVLSEIVLKIYSRKNTVALLTTNFTQSINYYEKLGIPLIVSLHLENNDIDICIEKIQKIFHCIAHIRIMAHPGKMELVENTYNKLKNLSSNIPLNFAVERIIPYGSFRTKYSEDDDNILKKMMPVKCQYPEIMKDKLGLLINLFYNFKWTYKNGSAIFDRDDGKDNFKSLYCERNIIVIHNDGEVEMSWCYKPKINIFESERLPNELFGTTLCIHKKCPMGFASVMPKYISLEYAPKYISDLKNVNNSISSKLLNIFKK